MAEIIASNSNLNSSNTNTCEYDMGSIIYGEGAVTNLDFHRNGNWLVMSTNESSIHLIDALTGEEKKKLYAKSIDGTNNIKFTHHESCVLFTGERNSYDIKYLCTYDNRYLSYFKGHTGKITSLSMSPADDCFISASTDKSVCLWNLSMQKPIAKLNLPNNCDHPYASFDESGVVFGVLCQDQTHNRTHQLKLYDARNYGAGPFQDIIPEKSLITSAIRKKNCDWSNNQLQKCIDSVWNSFQFSSDGNSILVNTQSDLLLVLDGFRSDVEPLAITSKKNESQLVLGSCLSPTSKRLLTATEDNELLMIDYKDHPGQITSLFTGHVAPVGCIQYNPKFDMIATACVNTVLWIPKTN